MNGVIALVEELTAKQRWRIGAPFEHINRHGGRAGMLWDPSPGFLPFSAHTDVVVLPGVAADELAIKRLHDQDLAVVLDTDDDLFTYGWTEHMLASTLGAAVPDLEAARQAQVWTVQNVDAVTVSTEPLAQLVRAIRGDDKVYVLPNALDIEWFRAGIQDGARSHGAITIGWAGGQRPMRDLEPMLEAWRRVSKRYPSVRFVWAGWLPVQIFRWVPPEQVTVARWSDGNAYADAMAVDIGCCPAEPTPFNSFKSCIKAWEFGAAGAAVIASPTPYDSTIFQFENGYLAGTADEWEQSLSSLIERGNLRADFAQALASDVEKHHDLATQWERWPETYGAIVGKWRAERLVHVR